MCLCGGFQSWEYYWSVYKYSYLYVTTCESKIPVQWVEANIFRLSSAQTSAHLYICALMSAYIELEGPENLFLTFWDYAEFVAPESAFDRKILSGYWQKSWSGAPVSGNRFRPNWKKYGEILREQFLLEFSRTCSSKNFLAWANWKHKEKQKG